MDADGHPPVTSRTTRLLVLVLVPLLAALATGAVLLASSGDDVQLAGGGRRLDATVTGRRELPCEGTDPAAGISCVRVEVRLEGEGTRAVLAERTAEEAAGLAPGDGVVVRRTTDATGLVTFELVGRRRGSTPAALALGVAVLVVLVARRRGLRLLVALAASAAVLVVFAVPALLDGGDPASVGIVAAGLLAVALAVLGRGPGARTATALVGTLLGVVVAGGVGHAVVEGADLVGVDPGFDVTQGTLPAAGLLLAGMVVGATGALLDLCTRVVDATWALRDAAPGWRGATAAGLRHSRSAAADVVATLAVAYAGSALPVLVLLSADSGGVLEELGSEALAVEVARTLTGALALLAAVPVTAALAAAIAVREAAGPKHGDPRRFRSRHERDLWEADVEA